MTATDIREWAFAPADSDISCCTRPLMGRWCECGRERCRELLTLTDTLEAQLGRYRNIITTLESELAETTDQLVAQRKRAGGLVSNVAELLRLNTAAVERINALENQLERYRNIITADPTDKAQLVEHLHTEVAGLRARVAELLKLNAEGRPWQITPKADA